ncbi:hypothetical protein H6P81_002283 [Aristolochia fimbriata]|uniref:Uncharacterized protein n=1 Tax=Aristolochia fimbriata TaxID=158543 RepID=A0AAV7F9D5_ARIFI|nr:hypothetical protein H6P81_002283 [Aristolochia fimbriata]
MGRIWPDFPRWMEIDLSVFSWTGYSSVFRWPDIDLSGMTPNWSNYHLDFSIVDTVLWSFVTAVESVAVVSMLCFFFLFCGCSI